DGRPVCPPQIALKPQTHLRRARRRLVGLDGIFLLALQQRQGAFGFAEDLSALAASGGRSIAARSCVALLLPAADLFSLPERALLERGVDRGTGGRRIRCRLEATPPGSDERGVGARPGVLHGQPDADLQRGVLQNALVLARFFPRHDSAGWPGRDGAVARLPTAMVEVDDRRSARRGRCPARLAG